MINRCDGREQRGNVRNTECIRDSTLTTAFYCQPITPNDILTQSGFPDDSLCACVDYINCYKFRSLYNPFNISHFKTHEYA